MSKMEKYFWQKFKKNYHQISLVDTTISKLVDYKELSIEAEKLSEKIKFSKKGLIFLFTTNNSESIITYIASLKSGNAVLLLDEKLNEEIRNGLIENYKPGLIITSNNLESDEYTHSFDFHSLKYFKRKKTIA